MEGVWQRLGDSLMSSSAPLEDGSSSVLMEGDSANVMVIVMAIICTIFSWVATLVCITQHINHWNSPPHQRIVVQMLSLVLIWSLFATLVVLRPQLIYITRFFMDTYEAYVVVLFMRLMVVYLGGDEALPGVIEKMPPFKIIPFVYTKPRNSIYNLLRVLIYQFAFFKPSFSLLRCVLYYIRIVIPTLGFNLKLILLIFQLLTLVSLFVVMFGLLKFYQMFQPVLSQYKVASKFMALKLFIFLHLIQGVIMGQFATPENHNQVYQLEYFTLCFEMAVAAVLMKYVVFTHREFLNDSTPVKPWVEYFRLDEARLTEWKNVLSSPHIVRQDSFYPENAQSSRVSVRSYQTQSNYSTMINNVYY